MPNFETEVNVTQDVTIEFEVYCNKCGAGLCMEASTTDASGRYSAKSLPSVHVNPCPDCIKEAKDEGHDEGYEEGKNES
jgi:hypothetical protein